MTKPYKRQRPLEINWFDFKVDKHHSVTPHIYYKRKYGIAMQSEQRLYKKSIVQKTQTTLRTEWLLVFQSRCRVANSLWGQYCISCLDRMDCRPRVITSDEF